MDDLVLDRHLADAWAGRDAGRLGDLAEADHDYHWAVGHDFLWASDAVAVLGAAEPLAPQLQGVPPRVELVALGQTGAAQRERCWSAGPGALKLDAMVGQGAALKAPQVLQQSAPELLEWRASPEAEPHLEQAQRWSVQPSLELQPGPLRQARLVSQPREQEPAVALPVFLRRPLLRSLSPPFQPWLLLRRLLPPAPVLELRRVL